MERIIINEVDNTSNVEALSSYDVVYVPGFSNNGASPDFNEGATLFRTPTLVTSKYEFLQKFGDREKSDSCPTFAKDQPYPIATETEIGFPAYAIPGYVPLSDPSEVVGLNNIECESTADVAHQIATIEATGYYSHANTSSGWVPTEGLVYYEAKKPNPMPEGSTFNFKMIRFEADGEDYDDRLIFYSNISPVNLEWLTSYGPEEDPSFIYTDDTYIEFVDSNPGAQVRSYYAYTGNKGSVKPALMFRGQGEGESGDADPGYRYALYLLSLGIPVYYEQMNSDFKKVNTDDPAVQAANPKEEDWFVRTAEGDYIRTDDPTVLPNKEYYMGADISIESMYKGLEARFRGRSDDSGDRPSDYSFDNIGDYAVKYITSGGYPTFEYGLLTHDPATDLWFGTSGLAQQMIRLAGARQDAVALIDHTNNPNRTIYESDTYSVISRIRAEFANLGSGSEAGNNVSSFGTMFTPWYDCTSTIISGGTGRNYSNQMPGSLAFLSALAQQLKTNNPWLAVSGVSRGAVPYCAGLHTNFTLTNNVADSYQVIPGDYNTSGIQSAVSINPITYIRNYGYCIWGNRTLRNNLGGTKSTSFLNIRNLVSDIKKRLYEASQQLMFEQNTDILWINFKAKVTPLLNTMVSNYILSDYRITKYNIDPSTGAEVPAYKILANIRIVPINSVEVFDLQVTLENSEVTVAETE